MYDILELSKYIICKFISYNKPLNNINLQKVLYLIQKRHLQNDLIAFKEDFEIYKNFLIIEDVYYEWCYYGVMPITRIQEYNTSIEYSSLVDDILTEFYKLSDKERLYLINPEILDLGKQLDFIPKYLIKGDIK